MQPVPELAALRAEHTHTAAIDLPAGQLTIIPGVSGDTLELVAELAVAREGLCSIVVRRSPDGAEQTQVSYHATLHQLIVDRTQASLDGATDRSLHVAPLMLGADEPLRLQIFLDRSVLEVFANERISITSRVYPTRADSVGLALLAERGAVNALDAWQMRP